MNKMKINKKKQNVASRQTDPQKTPKVWEKARREKMKLYFEDLMKILPVYDPANPMSRFEVLQKATSFIKDLQAQNQDLLNGGFDEVYKLKMERLKHRIKELLRRVDQLTDLLRTASITIPPAVVHPGGGTSWLKQRPKKWTEKLNVVVPGDKIDNVLCVLKDMKKRKRGEKSLKVKKSKGGKKVAKENEPVAGETKPETRTSETSNQVPANTFLLANGNLLPILNQTSSILTPVIVNRPPPVIVVKHQPPQVIQTGNIQILSNPLVYTPPAKTLPYILSKPPANKRRIIRDSTVTTYINKIPIPALSKSSYSKKFVLKKKDEEGVCGKVDSATQVGEGETGAKEPGEKNVFKPIPASDPDILNLPDGLGASLSVSPTAAFLSTFPIVAASKSDDPEEVPKQGKVEEVPVTSAAPAVTSTPEKTFYPTPVTTSPPTTTSLYLPQPNFDTPNFPKDPFVPQKPPPNQFASKPQTYKPSYPKNQFDYRNHAYRAPVYQNESGTKYQLVPAKEPAPTRGPVNWMTDNTLYQNPTGVKDTQSTQYQPCKQDKKSTGFKSNSYNIFDYNYNVDEFGWGRKKQVKKRPEMSQLQEPEASTDCFSWAPAKTADWAQNKPSFGVDANLIVPSTLPTLVGDLALCTTTAENTGKPKDNKLEPFANLSKNIFDVTNHDTIVLKNIFELPAPKKQRPVPQPQNFLSVSQLVENPSYEPIKHDEPKPDYSFNYHAKPYRNKRGYKYEKKYSGCKNTSYTAESLMRPSTEYATEPTFYNQKQQKTDFGNEISSGVFSDFNFSSPLPNFNLSGASDVPGYDNTYQPQNNSFLTDFVAGDYPMSDSVPSSLLLPPCSIGFQNPFMITPDKRISEKQGKKTYPARNRKHLECSKMSESLPCPPIFTSTTCQNLLPLPGHNSDANITFSNPFPANSNYPKLPPTTSTCVAPLGNPPTQSSLPLLSLPSHGMIPPSAPPTGSTTLANFNLSTIFPEINHKGSYQYP